MGVGVRYEDKRKWPATKPLKTWCAMSALGQKQTSEHVGVMSALPPKADIAERDWHVRYVAIEDIVRCVKIRRYSITSSARASNDGGTRRPSACAAFRLSTSPDLVGACTGR